MPSDETTTFGVNSVAENPLGPRVTMKGYLQLSARVCNIFYPSYYLKTWKYFAH